MSSGNAPTVDMTAVRNRIRDNMERIYKEDDSPEAMAKLGIDTIAGKATFVDPVTLSVETCDSADLKVKAKQGVVVCTGAKPKRPTSDDIEGIETVKYLTYEEIFDLDVLPKKMTVVGGGPVCILCLPSLLLQMIHNLSLAVHVSYTCFTVYHGKDWLRTVSSICSTRIASDTCIVNVRFM